MMVLNLTEKTYEYAKKMYALEVKLNDHNIPNNIEPSYEGFAMTFPWKDNCDVAIHKGTNGCLESIGFEWDGDDVTRLTPEDLAEKIIDCYR